MAIVTSSDNAVNPYDEAREKFCAEKLSAVTKLIRLYYPSYSYDYAREFARELVSDAFFLASQQVLRPPTPSDKIAVGGLALAISGPVLMEVFSIFYPVTTPAKEIIDGIAVACGVLIGTAGAFGIFLEKRKDNVVADDALSQANNIACIQKEAQERLCRTLRGYGCKLEANHL